jgi:protease-4
MVRIILFFLRSLVGILAVIGLAVVALAVLLYTAAGKYEPWDGKDREIPDVVVLTIDLEKGLPDRLPEAPFGLASLGDGLDLRSFLEALQAAGQDPRVKGLIAKVSRAPFAMAKAQEVRDAIKAFRATGKFAIAYADTIGELGGGTLPYYLASAFGEIWMMPSGTLGLDGVRLETLFVSKVLDDLGIEPRLGQREEYKSFAEMFERRSLSDPVRENLQQLVQSWHTQIAAGIAEGRGVTAGVASVLIDGGPYLAQGAVQHDLIDKLGYWDELLTDAAKRAGTGASLLTLAQYDKRRDEPDPAGPKIAVVYGEGPILYGESGDSFIGSYTMGAESVSDALAEALDNDDIKAVVFRVNSPGGIYVASDEIRRQVERAKSKKVPVIVSMGDVAASGGYFVAVDAARIVAQPGSVTGSIGVVGGKMVLSGLWDRIGVSFDAVQVGDNAGIMSAETDFTPAQWQILQDNLDAVYADFTGHVAAARDLDPQQLSAAAKGRIWTGQDALEVGLVDRLGGFETALAATREALGLSANAPLRLETFPAAKDTVEAFLKDLFGVDADNPGVLGALRGLAHLAETLAPVADALDPATAPAGTQLRAPVLRQPR